ncbi:hypothetical protein QE152_g37066 [Popillia japonica]|uniref:Transposable element P transposase-like GTP-binding insertion domain-containing protein n=1 Tax=Popillia japonica TaxID=7064 RepID=A0AAW1IBH5_POPJA
MVAYTGRILHRSFGKGTKYADMHVLPSKLKKMKVSMCTQVFSHNVAFTIELMARTRCESRDGKTKMAEDAEDTADLCSFLDELFDSMNADTLKEKTGKLLPLIT